MAINCVEKPARGLERTHSVETQTYAFSMTQFCNSYPIGRTKAYEEIKAGRLVARKIGAKTVILRPDAERWAASLPALDTSGSPE
jgi:hypothetical protein